MLLQIQKTYQRVPKKIRYYVRIYFTINKNYTDFSERLSNDYYKENFYFPWNKKNYQVITQNPNKNYNSKALPLFLENKKTNEGGYLKKDQNLSSYFVWAVVF